jgi:DNA-binding MarR family transcriptional regulator
MSPAQTDHLDQILEQWRRERPDLDMESLGVAGRLLRLTAYIDQKFTLAAESEFGLNRGQTDVLMALRRSGPPYRMSPTDLFSSMMVSSGCMTHRLDRLEGEGLVERFPDPADRRGIKVGLTDKGFALSERLLPVSRQVMEPISADLSADERRQLSDLLRRMLLRIEGAQQ